MYLEPNVFYEVKYGARCFFKKFCLGTVGVFLALKSLKSQPMNTYGKRLVLQEIDATTSMVIQIPLFFADLDLRS